MKFLLKLSGLFVIAIVVSWLITVGLVKVIAACFGVECSLLVATGIWLCLWLLGSIFKK